ncbi:unnamed protein product [Brassica oleracea var. botrytis]
MSFNTQALFHATRSLQFKPPSDLLSILGLRMLRTRSS